MKPKNNLAKMGGSKFLTATAFSAFLLLVQTAAAGPTRLTWQEADDSSEVGVWMRRVMQVIMGIFAMVAVILGSLAFKQLSADGNWKDFWSKIAGAIGMFVVPIAVWWAIRN